MNLRQMQVALDTYQDRLFLRFSMDETDEVSVIITRRLLTEMWAMLLNVLDVHGQNVGVFPNVDEEASVSLMHEFDPSSAFENPNPTFPMGVQPLLIGEVGIESTEDDRFTLFMREPRARQFAINLERPALHMLCSMLKAAAETGQWGLSLDLPGSNVVAPSVTSVTTPPKHLLH